ncbi:class I SAM-dependent methyltransferase [Georgenia sp. Z1491]|uniref:class I SAM-dependent methyltransferase n=1 Tax=Georgenia sp. Z1491 TaxID=3416707 RepID=UPI003CFA8113
MMTTTQIEQQDVGAVVQHVAGLAIGAATSAMIVVGDRLGLYGALAGGGAVTPQQLADATGTSERYVREWLAQQAAAGLVVHDATDGTFTLPPASAAVLADDDSPAAMTGMCVQTEGLFRDIDLLVDAFRTGAGIGWGEHSAPTFEGAERSFGAAYRAELLTRWVPALDGVTEALDAGARVADVGTGRGVPVVLLAQAFPRSEFVGYDTHPASIEVARRRAEEAGVADRVRFEVHDCQGYPQDGYDLVTFFDAFHDLGDPVGAAAYARHALVPGGSLVLIEPRAADDLPTNLAGNPVAAFGYAASTFLCTPSSLSQPVGTALGGQAGSARVRGVLDEAGFSDVRHVADSMINMVIQARA